MPLKFFITVRTLTDDLKPMFPGVSGVSIYEVTVKCRTNGVTIASNIDETDGYTIAEGASMDVIEKGQLHEGYDLNNLYWKNTTPGSNCVIEIFGIRRV